jgi:hypothetical protein
MAPFQYDTFQPNTGTIADLMQAGARARANAARQAAAAQAHAAEQRGRNTAIMVGSLGNIATDLSGQIIRHYDGAPGRELQKQQLVANQREMDASQQAARDTSTAKAIMPFALTENADGVATFDREVLTREFSAAGMADKLPALLKGLDDADAASLGLKKAKQDFAQKGLDGLLRSVEASGATPEGLKLAADYAVKNGLYSKQEADQVLTFVGNDPARAKQAIQRLRGQEPKLHNAPAGTSVLDANNPEAGPIHTTPNKPDASSTPNIGSFEDYVVRKYGPNPTPEQIAEGRKVYQQADDRPFRPIVPIIMPTAGGQIVSVDRETNTSKVVTGPDGKPLGQADTAATREQASARKRLTPLLDSVAELTDRINVNQGVYAKMAGGAAKQAAKVNLDDDVAEYEAMVKAFTPLWARALGHVGVLTQQDVDSAKEALPRPGDSKSLKDRKLARIEKILGGTSGATTEAAPASGKKVGRFEIVKEDK